MKKNLLFVSMAVLSLGSYAQTEAISPRLEVFSPSPSTIVKADANESSESIWWGYCKEGERWNGVGMGFDDMSQSAGIYVPNSELLAGKTVTALRFKVRGTNAYSSFHVWVTADDNLMDCKDSVDFEQYKYVDPTTLNDSVWNVVEIKPKTIGTTGFYIGYQMYIPKILDHDSDYPILVSFPQDSNKVPMDEAFWQYDPPYMSGWQSGNRYGHLLCEVCVEGEFIQNSASISTYDECVTTAGSTVDLPVKIEKLGARDVQNISYVITTDGVAGEEQQLTLETPITSIGSPVSVNIPYTASAETKISTCDIQITKVNGQENEAQASSATCTGTVFVASESAHRRVAMEEFTGGWCGYCPRGIIGMSKLSDEFGSDFIGLTVHQGDPMEIMAYSNILANITEYPLARLNREIEADPYGGTSLVNYGIKDDFLAVKKEVAEASVDVTASWESAEKAYLDAQAEVTFNLSSEKNPYAVAFVLTSDSLSCPNESEWIQTNYFYYFKEDEEYTSNPDFADFLSQPEYITDMVYRNVVIDGYGLDEGIEESVVAPIVKGTAQKCSISFDIEDNNLVQDRDKLKVTALLIDTMTGRIVNAGQVAVPTEFDGIESISATTTSTYYNINGVRQNGLKKGVNIVREGNNVKKIIY